MKRTAAIVAAILFQAVVGKAQGTLHREALTSLVEAERSFAATSLKIGARPSFMQFFADDAMVFRPHPVKYKEAMKSVPMPKNPTETTLEWEPIWADIAISGDLGYTTGPSVWTDHTAAKRPRYYGFYFSFWKKQASGVWQVIFDVGTELPGPFAGSREFHAPDPVKRTTAIPPLSTEEHREEMIEAERVFFQSLKEKKVQTLLQKTFEPDARVYRQGFQPVIGLDSIQSFFLHHPYLTSGITLNAVVSAAGDLGYSIGSYTALSSAGTATVEKGYYLHAWRRDAASRWKLVAEVTSPLPPESPSAK